MEALNLKINKSRLMSRAWYLVKNQGYPLTYAMKKVWAEMKEWIAEKIQEAANDIKAKELKAYWATPEYKAYQQSQGNAYKPFVYDLTK